MKKQTNIVKISLIVGILFIAILFSFKPLFDSLNFGLDLKGGFEVLYRVKPIDNNKLTNDMVKSTYKTILKRIDVLGVSEPNITIEGNDKIRVQLAGITDAKEAKDILSKTANLTFRDTDDNLLMTSEVLKSGGAKLSSDEYGLPAVLLTIKDKDKFYDVTNRVKDFQDNRIVIWLDFDEEIDSFDKEQNNCGSLSKSKCLSAALVKQGFASDVIIQGRFSVEEATALVELINSGSLPTKLEEISSRTVSALFGAPILNMTLKASIIGIILIFIFLGLIYRLAGIVASIGLIFYAYIVFIFFYLIGGVLTLPGIAAMALGIGMAVDANVLTFERIKEELYSGKSLMTAFINGHKKAFIAIFDGNFTTLIVAIVLFILGESSVKGFATMLIINIILTMLVIVYLTKWIVGLFVKTKYFDDKTKLFIGVKNSDIPDVNKNEKKVDYGFKKIDFVKHTLKWVLLSLIIIIAGTIITTKYGLNLGIDYRGGSNVTIINNDKFTIEQIKNEFNELGYEVDNIEMYKNEIYIRIDEDLTNDEIAKIDKYFIDKYDVSTEIDVISQVVKKELTINAIYAVLYASIGIILYMTLRYRLTFAIAAFITLVHDILITIAIFSIFRLEISTMFVAAILTIIGYSVNDTIVYFDRIVENIELMFDGIIKNKEEINQVVDASLRQTVLRSLYTVISTLLPVIALILFGSVAIINFDIALFVGLVAGTYSSIFMASQIWLMMEQKNLKQGIKKKKWFDNLGDELDELTVKGINK